MCFDSYKRIKLFSIIGICLLLLVSGYGCADAFNEEEHQEIARQIYLERMEGLTPSVSDYIAGGEEDTKPVPEPDRIVSFFIHSITVHCEPSIAVNFTEAIRQWQGRRMTAGDIQHLLDDLNNRIRQAGYITTKAVIPPQNISTGTLLLTVIPGRIHGFSYEPGSEIVNYKTAFPTKPGDVLNIRALEQGLENIRHAYGQDVRIKIMPAGYDGESEILLYGIRNKNWGITFSYNNHGSKASGLYRIRGDGIIGNLFGLNDKFVIGFGGNGSHTGRYKTYDHTHISYSMPYKSYMFFYRGHISHTGQAISTSFHTFPYTEKIHGHEWRIEKGIKRDQRMRWKLSAAIETYKKSSFIAGTELNVQRLDKTNLKVGISCDRYLCVKYFSVR